MKANSNQSVLRTLAKLGAGADVVSGGELKRALAAGFPAEQDPVFRRRQDRGRTARRARRRHPLHQRRIRVRARPAVAPRGGGGQDRAHLRARQSRCRCRHPCQDLDRQVREQVRHPDRACARRLCQGRQAAGIEDHRRRHAHRQPDHRSRPSRGRLSHPRGFRARAARRRPRHFAYRFRRRARHSLLQGSRSRRPRRTPMRRWSSASRTISAAR